jgi:hypothetical protein
MTVPPAAGCRGPAAGTSPPPATQRVRFAIGDIAVTTHGVTTTAGSASFGELDWHLIGRRPTWRRLLAPRRGQTVQVRVVAQGWEHTTSLAGLDARQSRRIRRLVKGTGRPAPPTTPLGTHATWP